MGLSILFTHDERLISPDVVRCLRRGIRQKGSHLLLVPSIEQVLEAQRELASHPDLRMGVDVTTPSIWVRDQWKLWGDGRELADSTVLTVLAYETLRSATPDERDPLALLPGTVAVLVKLVAQSLPWLPLDESGCLQEKVLAQAQLAYAETRLVGLAGKTARVLHDHGYVSAAEASHILPQLLTTTDSPLPDVTYCGFEWMSRSERELVQALAHHRLVDFVASVLPGPASQRVRQLVAQLREDTHSQALPQPEPPDSALPAVPAAVGANATPPAATVDPDAPATPGAPAATTTPAPLTTPHPDTARNQELQELLDALFGDTPIVAESDAPLELLLPAGPVAEAEIVAARVAELADAAQKTGLPIVIAVPDVTRAHRELIPKLEARGISARIHNAAPLVESSRSQALIGFMTEVARLSELAATWPEPAEGLEGPVPRLGDMSWWPPRTIIDFLFDDMAQMEPAKVWKLDASWRGNRLLTPAQVLRMLQSERTTSPAVARATTELLRGRIGSMAAKLLAPYTPTPPSSSNSSGAESRAILGAILKLSGTLRSLGVTFDPAHPEDRPLSELVSLMEWASGGMQLVTRMGFGSQHATEQVTVLSTKEATRLPCDSAHTLVLCGLTSSEQALEGREDVLQAMLERLGIEPKADALAQARADFRKLVGVARERLVVERILADSEGAETYPSVMLCELLAAYGISASSGPSELPLRHRLRSERVLSQNLNRTGTPPTRVDASIPTPEGKLTGASRQLVFVPQAGKELLPGGLPVLSASQIETYLECPRKWFSLRRLRLGSVDAGHGAPETGSFAHRVLELTHRELLVHALEREASDTLDEAGLLAQVEADPCRHIPGSRVDNDLLEQARATLELNFDLHQQHMYMVRNPRALQQLLVAHNSAERAQERQLKDDLLSTLAYETRILQGFEPRFFEWGFGRHDDLVPYAGAYFTGTVDRIDVSAHGTAVIIDYKHKRPLGFGAEYDALSDGVLEGVQLPARVQSLIYAQIVQRAFEDKLRVVGSVYLSTKAPHDLAGVADQNVADLVFGPISARRLPRVSVPAHKDATPGMADLLDHTEELIAEQVAQMRAGNVEARPRDQRSCDFCPVTHCERRVAR